MAIFSSKKIESQYILIKMLLSDKRRYKKAIRAIKKDISYTPLELNKKVEKENIVLQREQTKNGLKMITIL